MKIGKKKRSVALILLLSTSLTTGCWDRVDINDRALLLGWGMDITDTGKYQSTAQFAIPQKLIPGQNGGSQGRAFFSATGIGENIQAAAQDMQSKLSRVWFASQRRTLVIGEGLAKQGIQEVLDEYSRNPTVRLRTDFLVVKGGTANLLLKQPYPLERIPAFAPVNIHEAMGLQPDVTLRNFLMAASCEGDTPVLPAFQVMAENTVDKEQDSQNEPTGHIKVFGLAIFDDNLKLKGYLNFRQSITRRWIRGELRTQRITSFIPHYHGNVALEMHWLKSRVYPTITGNKVKIQVLLTGKGLVNENNTNLDLTQVKNIQILERSLNHQAEQQALGVIHTMQREYGLDSFGFGQLVHRKYPKHWRTMKSHWNKDFSNADISVSAKITVSDTGLTGPPLLLKKNEIQK